MIRPGILTHATAREATEYLRQGEQNRQAVERRKKSVIDRPYVKLTDYDSATQAYSWTEQTFDANGLRIDDQDGRTGTPEWMPAYAYGDGSIIPNFPLETRLRQTIQMSAKGPVYEFPAYCGCALPGSGTFSGAGVYVPCCPDVNIPTVLYAHVVGCDCITGTFPLYFGDNNSPWWEDRLADHPNTCMPHTIAPLSLHTRLICQFNTVTSLYNWVLLISNHYSGGCLAGRSGADVLSPQPTCARPFSVTISDGMIVAFAGLPCACANTTFTMTINETP